MKLKMEIIKGSRKLKQGSQKSSKKGYKTPKAVKNFLRKTWY